MSRVRRANKTSSLDDDLDEPRRKFVELDDDLDEPLLDNRRRSASSITSPLDKEFDVLARRNSNPNLAMLDSEVSDDVFQVPRGRAPKSNPNPKPVPNPKAKRKLQLEPKTPKKSKFPTPENRKKPISLVSSSSSVEKSTAQLISNDEGLFSEPSGMDIDPDSARSSDGSDVDSQPEFGNASEVSEDVVDHLAYTNKQRKALTNGPLRHVNGKLRALMDTPAGSPASPFHDSQQAQRLPSQSQSSVQKTVIVLDDSEADDADSDADEPAPLPAPPAPRDDLDIPDPGHPLGDAELEQLEIVPEADKHRFRGKHLFITIPQSGDRSPKQIGDAIEAHPRSSTFAVANYYIVSEKHADGTDHIHAKLEFEGKRGQVAFATLDEVMGIPGATVGTWRRNNYGKVRSLAKATAYMGKAQEYGVPRFPFVCRRYVSGAWIDFSLELYQQYNKMTFGRPGSKTAPLYEHLYKNPGDLSGAAKIDPVAYGSNIKKIREANQAYLNLSMYPSERPVFEEIPLLTVNDVGTHPDFAEHNRLIKFLNTRIPELQSGKKPPLKNNAIYIEGPSNCHKSSLVNWLAKFLPIQSLQPNETFNLNGYNSDVPPTVLAFMGYQSSMFSWPVLENLIDCHEITTFNSKNGALAIKRPQYIFEGNVSFDNWYKEKISRMGNDLNLVDGHTDALLPEERQALKNRFLVFKLTSPLTFFPNPETLNADELCTRIDI